MIKTFLISFWEKGILQLYPILHRKFLTKAIQRKFELFSVI